MTPQQIIQVEDGLRWQLKEFGELRFFGGSLTDEYVAMRYLDWLPFGMESAE